ncbi:hypothetical protein DFH27DRAFT_270297 [Peziza echinospora]|nr:hypothetical protein DFH27DRAFT_270297 [Peziza echinospora]
MGRKISKRGEKKRDTKRYTTGDATHLHQSHRSFNSYDILGFYFFFFSFVIVSCFSSCFDVLQLVFFFLRALLQLHLLPYRDGLTLVHITVVNVSFLYLFVLFYFCFCFEFSFFILFFYLFFLISTLFACDCSTPKKTLARLELAMFPLSFYFYFS